MPWRHGGSGGIAPPLLTLALVGSEFPFDENKIDHLVQWLFGGAIRQAEMMTLQVCLSL
jgi:hypothetical protein